MKLALTLLMAAAGGAMAWGQEPAPIKPEEFTSIHAQLRAKEKWESVPWKTDLRDAWELSIQEKKPIFMMVDTGNPIGFA